jgi:hypothetical protein
LSEFTSDQITNIRAVDFARHVVARFNARGNVEKAAALFEEHYEKSFSRSLIWQGVELWSKAAVLPATTTDVAWAKPLLDVQELVQAFANVTRPREIPTQLVGVQKVPANVPVPVWTPTATTTATFVGEGGQKMVVAFSFTAASLLPAKIPLIAVVSNELLRFGRPDTAPLLRDLLIMQITMAVNAHFIDPAKAPVVGVSPGCVTNAGTLVATQSDVTKDATAVLGALVAARPQVANPTLIMSPAHAQALIATGQHDKLELTGGRAFGAQVIVNGAAGKTIAAIDPTAVHLWDDDLTIDASRSATIQLDSAPITGAEAVALSMFQNNMVALKTERWINWKLVDPKGCQYTTQP